MINISPPSRKCLVCRKLFVKPPSCGMPEWKSRRKFCSPVCSWNYKKGKHYSPGSEFSVKRHYVPPTAYKPGDHAAPGTEFKKGHMPWSTGKIMSPEMREKLRAAGFFRPKFGPKSGNWKGGRTKLQAAIRTCPKYLAWRQRVFERDNYTCQWCGRRRKSGDRVIIHADHILPFSLILTKYKIQTLAQALACKALWKTRNGRTLCVECHRKTETYKLNQYT